MDQTRIGELLSRIIPLSEHDVEEILHEQSASNRKFGDIAMALGLCKPEHILKAWLSQLESQTQRVCIDSLGVDAQAVAQFPADLARKHDAIPVRLLGDELLLAVAHIPDAATLTEIETRINKRLKIVLADIEPLQRTIERFYPVRQTA
jgi:type IV pilus assembly protein PilB